MIFKQLMQLRVSLKRALFPILGLFSLLSVLFFGGPLLEGNTSQNTLKRDKIIPLSPNIEELMEFIEGQKNPHETLPQHAGKPQTSLNFGRLDQPNLEKLIYERPDWVLLSEMTPKMVETQIQELGLKTQRFNFQSLDSIYQNLSLIAKLMGFEKKILFFKSTFPLKPKTKSAQKKLKAGVLYNEENLYAAGRGSFVDEVLTLSGFDNAFAFSKSPWPQINPEFLIQNPPDIIFSIKDHEPSGKTRVMKTTGAIQIIEQFGTRIEKVKPDGFLRPGIETLKLPDQLLESGNSNCKTSP